MEFKERCSHLLPRAVNPISPYPVERGEGSHLYTTDGRKLIDFTTGIAVNSVGHAHPKVVRAIQDATERGNHFAFQVIGYESYVALIERLTAKLPVGHHWKGVCFSTGAEAIDNAMKIARHATARPYFLAFEHGFHGRTYGALSLTSKPGSYKAGFGPFVPEVVQLPFPSQYRCAGCAGVLRGCDCAASTLARIEQVFATRVPASEVAAVFVEPIVGEGGFYVPPPGFMKGLRDLCTRHGILLVVDEIQTGMCRTGTFYRFEAEGIVPDMVVTAKAIGGGMPLSAVLGKAEVLDSVHPGGLGGTYGGNPVAVAAAHAVLDIADEENLSQMALERGILLTNQLRAWYERFESIGDVRGVGLMQAMEVVSDRASKVPDKERVSTIVRRSYESGLALLSAGTWSNVIRFLPALNIPFEVLNEGLEILEGVLAEVLEQ